METMKHDLGSQVGGSVVWDEYLPMNIPGSTRVPVEEICSYFNGVTDGLTGLDVGSGRGRSAKILKEYLPGSHISALDISFEGLADTEAKTKIQAKAEELPFKPNSFDFVNVCGVMTNLVDKDPKKALELRVRVVLSLYSILKSGGCIAISDFGADHLFDRYPVNYNRHKLITQEYGTIAVLKNGDTFIGKSDDEVKALRNTNQIERYSHHYTIRELIDLLRNAPFEVYKYSVELAQTPKGNKTIDNVIVLAKKPINHPNPPQ